MAIDFKTDEQFHQWCKEHQDDGFFVGYVQGYPPKIPGSITYIPRMHRASCGTVSANQVGRYRKCGSTDRSSWSGISTAKLEHCKRCRPDID